MATVVNTRDVLLQAAASRLASVSLPASFNIPGAKALALTAPGLIFQVPTSGSATPTSITVSAVLTGLSGECTWSVTAGTATLTGNGNSRSLAYADMGSDYVTIQAQLVDGATTYTATIGLAKQREADIVARQPVALYITGTAWSDADANTAITTSTGNAWRVVGDTVTIRNGTTFTATKTWNGARWDVPGQVLGGSVIIPGTLAGRSIIAGDLTADRIKAGTQLTATSGVSFGFGTAWTPAPIYTGAFTTAQLVAGGVRRSADASKFADVVIHAAGGVASVAASSASSDAGFAQLGFGSYSETDGKFLTVYALGGGDTAGIFRRHTARGAGEVQHQVTLAGPTYGVHTDGPAYFQGGARFDNGLVVNGGLEVTGALRVTGGPITLDGVEIGTSTTLGKRIWRYEIPGLPYCYSTPVRATLSGTDCIVFQAWNGAVHAIRTDTGALVWTYNFAGNNYGRCAVASGYTGVVACSHDGTIRGLSASGAWVWTFQNLYHRKGHFGSSGTLTDGGGYFIEDTSANWPANAFQRGSAALNGIVVITSGAAAGQESPISASNGTDGFWVDTEFDPPPAAGDGYYIKPRYESDIYWQHAGTLNQESGTWYLYAGGFDNTMVKINAATGALVWEVCALENIEPFPLVTTLGGSTRILFACVDGKVYARNTDGSAYWTTDLSAPLDAFLEAADVNGDAAPEILVNSRDNKLHVLSGTTGAVLSVGPDTGEDLDTKPLVLASGKVAIVGDSGRLYLLTYAAGTMTTDWTNATALGRLVNASPVAVDCNAAGTDEILYCDMNGFGYIVKDDGTNLTTRSDGIAFIPPGPVEGTPLAGDLLGTAGKRQVVFTSLGGIVEMHEFPK